MLPAVLTLLGTRVNSLAPRFLQRRAEADTRPDESGFWYRLSRFVMRRPIPVATLSAALLIVIGIPFFEIKFDTVDPTVLPKSASARQAYDAVSSEFPPYRETPIWVDVEGGGPRAAARFAAQVRRVPGVAEVAPPQRLEGRRRPRCRSSPPTPSSPTPARTTVKRIRDLRPPPGTTALVGGATADFVDLQSSLASHLPIVLGDHRSSRR